MLTGIRVKSYMPTSLKKFRVLQLCLSSSWGGLEMVALEMSSSLNEYGVLNCVAPGSVLEKRLSAHGQASVGLAGKKKSYISRARALRRIIKEGNFEVILLHHLHDLWYLRLALIGLPKPRVVGWSHTFVGVRKKDAFHRWIYGILDCLIPLTEAQKSNLIEHLPLPAERLQVIPNAVDVERFHPSKRSDDIRKEWVTEKSPLLVGLIGRLDAGKGQSTLIEATQALRARGVDNFRVVLVGEDTLNNRGTEASLRELVARLGLEHVVVFAGFRSDVPEIMASLDIVTMPSDAETFGRVLIEAMAAGTPVVATGLGGVRDIVDDGQTGLLISKKDPEELADALEKLLVSRELREKLSAAALEKARAVYAEDVVMRQVRAVVFG